MTQAGSITNDTVMNPTTTSSFHLPPELLVEILSYLENQQFCLYSASLVNKQWFYCAVPILYSHPRINDTYLWATFILTLTRERMSLFYGDLVRSVDLSSGKYIEIMNNSELYRPFTRDPNVLQPEQPDGANGRLNNLNNLNRLTRINIRIISRHERLIRHGTLTATTTTNNNNNNDHDVVIQENSDNNSPPWKPLPFITVSTSSLFQLSHNCKNLTKLNLSYTILLEDALVAETGEYLSTLQHHANQPGLTHIQIPIEAAIQNIGKYCQHLEEVKVQRCEWVTAYVIWMFVHHCLSLRRLDARNSTKCTIKRLITRVLEATDTSAVHESEPISNTSSDADSESESALSSSAPSIAGEHAFPVASEEMDEENDIAEPFVFDDDNLNGNGTLGMQIMREIDPNQQEEMEQALRGAFWFVPTPHHDIYHERRPPSPIYISTPSTTYVPAETRNQSLNGVVRAILEESRASGMNDLSWLQDY